MAKKIAKKESVKKPRKARDLGVTQRLLDLKIQEVKGDISSLRLETKAGFARVDARFTKIESRFAQIDARFARMDERFAQIDARFARMDERFAQMDVRFAQMDAKFEVMQTQITKMLVLLEEQTLRNNVALDGYSTIYEKFQEYTHRFDKMEKYIFGIKQN